MEPRFDYNAPPPRYEAGNRELKFALGLLVLGTLQWNAGGLGLDFAVWSIGLLGWEIWYVWGDGKGFRGYPLALLALCGFVLAGFARTDDTGLKLPALLLVHLAGNLALCLGTGQNRRHREGLTSLLDGPRAFWSFGVGGMGKTARGLREALGHTGRVGKTGSAAALGLLLALPLVALAAFLLMRADAAFEGLMDLLPEADLSGPLESLFFGFFAAWIAAARGLGLLQKEKPQEKSARSPVNPVTLNTLLGALGMLYCIYFASQLAYLGGGFSGILPEGYTLAQYARRGFFEMAWLGAINLGLITLSLALSGERPGNLTRGLCLFLGLTTLFLISAASAKMLLYIGSYGLTRLRLLTQTAMLGMAVATVLVMLRILGSGFGYLPGALLTALILTAVLLWADVDGQVARYNVRAYQSGRLETVDVLHLSGLGDGAVPYIEELTQDENPEIARWAMEELQDRRSRESDLRSWNAASARAVEILEEYP